jgi:peptidoglycan/LPS O-acetylase OafA/YrhL
VYLNDVSTKDERMTKGLIYRPDIQSLRALAIGLVIAAHAHLPGFQGGFVGVDVFFVLSGFLISGLILKEVEETRKFSALTFYARRIKRLLPALLVVLFSIAFLGWLLSSPLLQSVDAEAGQAASLWLSNFYFSSRIINYFSVGLDGNLFLHTWSLGVEEQFYLFWPWSFLFLLGVWRWQKAPFDRRRLVNGLIVVAMVSLGLGVYWAYANPEVGFYLVPGRIWEFALGALAFLLREHVCSADGKKIIAWLRKLQGRSLLNTVGFILILLSAVLFSGGLPYPGFLALLPAFGAVLILLDAPERRPDSQVAKISLHQPSVQFLGNISYSLYLWHWPILVLAGQIFGQFWYVYLIAVILSIVLATLTYFFVENPIRRIHFKSVWPVLFPAALTMTVAFYAMGLWQLAISRTLSSPAQSYIQAAASDLPVLYDFPDCDTWYHSAKVHSCTFGPKEAKHTLVLFGDSVLAQWFPAFAQIYLSRPNWHIVVLTKSACPASDVSFYYAQIKSRYTVCDEWRENTLNEIVKLRPDVVVMGSTHYGFSRQQWVSGTRKVLDRLSPAAQSIVVMSPTPELGFNGLNCLAAKKNWPNWLPEMRHCESSLQPVSTMGVLSALKQAVVPFSNAHVFDFRNDICPGGQCRAEMGNTIVYRDGQHLTASFVLSLAGIVENKLIAANIPH